MMRFEIPLSLLPSSLQLQVSVLHANKHFHSKGFPLGALANEYILLFTGPDVHSHRFSSVPPPASFAVFR